MAKKPKWKIIYRYVTRSSKDPESLARGVGLGLFVGFLPSFGFQLVLAFMLAGFLNANRIVAMFGTLVTNPFTVLPLSAFSLWFGDLILPGSRLSQYSLETFKWSSLMESPGQLGISYIVGCISLSVITGVLGYALMRFYYLRTRSRQNKISGT